LGFSRENILIHWRLHKYLYILVAVVFLANLPVFARLVSDWLEDGNYSHGFLIIPVVVYLLWRKRKELVFPARPSGWGILLLGFGALGFIMGTAAGEYFTARISLLIIISGISLYHLGNANFKKVWFPFAFMVFMIPIPAVVYYSATLPMQLFSSKVTNLALHLLGMPSARQGNIIYLPQYALEVVEACSGLRSLVSLLALSSLYGYLTLPGKVRPVILFIAAIPIAIVTNIARLILTAIAAYTVGARFAEGFLHETAGVIVFALAFILIIITGSVLKWLGKRS
jgi:exosortase